MKTIYRIQDKDGIGPFKLGKSKNWVEFTPDKLLLLPFNLQVDQLKRTIPKSSFGHGCANLDQLRRWFTRLEYSRLIQLGYSCVEMQVDRIVIESHTQILFERAKKLSEDCTTIHLYSPS